jgi:hypothetical protein
VFKVSLEESECRAGFVGNLRDSFILIDFFVVVYFTDEVIKPDPNTNPESIVCGLKHPRTGVCISL